MKILLMVKGYLLRRKKLLFMYIALSIILWFLTIMLPSLTGKYMDMLASGGDNQAIFTFTEILACVLAANIVFSFIKNLVINKLSNSAAFGLNFDVLEHVKRLPVNYFNNVNASYLTQRINSDSYSVTMFAIENMIGIAVNILTFLALSLYMASISTTVTVFLLLLIPAYIGVYAAFRSKLFKKQYEYKEKLNIFFSKMNEQLYKIKLIKINSWQELLGKELKDSFNPLYKSAIDLAKITGFYSGSSSAVTSLSKVLMFLFGGLEVLKHHMTIGQFTAINVYFSMILDCTSYFLSLGNSYQQTLVSFARLKEITDIKPEHNGTKTLSHIDKIEFQNVNFGYEGGKRILIDFNSSFKKGEVYCIAGKNGIGKSTLIDLMLGLHGDYTGEILYNGASISDLDMHTLRKNMVGVCEQEPTLFNDTVLKNLTFGITQYRDDSLKRILSDIMLEDFIERLPEGMDSNISEKAGNISGGEKQKLSIARTLMKDAQVLIFDEPTSAMDVKSVGRFKSIINELKKDKIVIIITHSENLLDIADRVLQFKENFDIPKLA